MKIIIFTILILCAFNLYVAKSVSDLIREGMFYEGVKLAAKKALRYILNGMVVLGLCVLALSQFDFIRKIGFTYIPEKWIEVIRDAMRLVLDSSSVYRAIEFLMGVTVLSLEISLICSFVGFCIAKAFVFLQALSCSRIHKAKGERHQQQVEIPYSERKIFLSYAHLRI